MDAQQLSHRLDSLIADLLAQRRRRLQDHGKVMRVVLSGEDLATLPTTLDCLTALNRRGYLLAMTFSHSAIQASLHSTCLEALAHRDVEALCDDRDPCPTEETFSGLYLPSLSTNSLSKIALGIRDNRVCRWAFHALSLARPIIVTLNTECRDDAASQLPRHCGHGWPVTSPLSGSMASRLSAAPRRTRHRGRRRPAVNR